MSGETLDRDALLRALWEARGQRTCTDEEWAHYKTSEVLAGSMRRLNDELDEQIDAGEFDAPVVPSSTAQTWTFVGHWGSDRIVVEYVVPGEHQDPRIDTGYWEEGLFASSATADTMAEAEALVRAEYEQHEDEDEDES